MKDIGRGDNRLQVDQGDRRSAAHSAARDLANGSEKIPKPSPENVRRGRPRAIEAQRAQKEHIAEFVKAAPKTDLHVHFDGAVPPETLPILAERNGMRLPTGVETQKDAHEWLRFRTFSDFVKALWEVSSYIKKPRDFELVIDKIAQKAIEQNTRYLEITVTLPRFLELGVKMEDILGGLERGRTQALESQGVHINYIFDLPRASKDSSLFDVTTGAAIDGQGIGVVALGLGGNEKLYPADLFTRWFDRALAAGLSSAPHAGEQAGPASVWSALRNLHADRIGHGVRAVEDPALVSYLAQQKIPLEIALTSNVRLNIYPTYQSHPFPALLEAGVSLTINTDNPVLFGTQLSHEYEKLSVVYGLDIATISDIMLNGVRASFLPPEQKGLLLANFNEKIMDLQNKILRDA